jgi:hypothetical protein
MPPALESKKLLKLKGWILMAVFIICTVAAILLACATLALVSIWVYRDAKSRGLSNAGLWVLVTILVNLPIGLLIYLMLGRKDAPAPASPVRPRPYIIAGVLCFILSIGSVIGGTVYSLGDFASIDSSHSVGMIQSSWNGEWTMRFGYSNSTQTKRVSLPEGVPLTAEASCSEGSITLMVTADGYSELFRLSDGEMVNLTFPPDSGRSNTSVRLSLDCTKARDGDIRIRWR